MTGQLFPDCALPTSSPRRITWERHAGICRADHQMMIDGKPTAFRAHEKDELLPTFNQLRRTNKDVVFKWFARGRIWESPEAELAAQRQPVLQEKRPRDWRPGGEHKDPRARFKKSGDEKRGKRAGSATLPNIRRLSD